LIDKEKVTIGAAASVKQICLQRTQCFTFENSRRAENCCCRDI